MANEIRMSLRKGATKKRSSSKVWSRQPLTLSTTRDFSGRGLPQSRTYRHDFLFWQLADSAFPTGGFAHSGGLEAAWQHGEVANRGELVSFIEASLHQLGHAALPFVTAAYR